MHYVVYIATTKLHCNKSVVAVLFCVIVIFIYFLKFVIGSHYFYNKKHHTIIQFLPTPLAVAWVNILTFSPSPSPSSPHPSHLQLFVYLRYRKHHEGAWVLGSVCHLVSYTYITVVSGLSFAAVVSVSPVDPSSVESGNSIVDFPPCTQVFRQVSRGWNILWEIKTLEKSLYLNIIH